MIDEALAQLLVQPWYRGQVVHVERTAAAPARFWPDAGVPAAVRRYLDEQGLRLYRHQGAAIEAWQRGEDVLVATSTASGKSLAFNCCAATSLLEDRGATALYLYPTKALARDQLEHLVALDRALALGARPAVLDGDTPSSARPRIRREARLVVSNPHALHEYLAQPASLQRFLAHLSVVVVDEAHRYRGVFGANVALVLRRLQRLAERLGARPRFVLATATIGNPGEHGRALVGREVTVVDDDGGPRGERAVALFDSTADPTRSPGRQAAAAVAALVAAGQTTICFTGSRVLAELVAGWAQGLAPRAAISPYRAGYLPAERREIEARLRSGELDAVVSTNALELGIDVGGLDAVVLCGYPGTVSSTFQQIGRAGRAQRPALAVLVAGDDPLDAYLVRRPSVLFGAPMERAVLALDNARILTGQVCCAAAELPVAATEVDRFGARLPAVVADLEAEGLVAPVGAGHGFVGTFRPASAVRLDGRADDGVELRVGGKLLELLDGWRAMRHAHRGARYLHRGEQYRIVELDLEAGLARAEPDPTPEHTRSVVEGRYDVESPERARQLGDWVVGIGAARVRRQVVAFKRYRGDELLSTEALELPVSTLETRGLSVVPAGGRVVAGSLPGDPLAALHAAEHALIHAMPLLAMCDRGDVGGASTLLDPGRAGPLVVLYDGYDGGAGLAETAYERFGELVAVATDMLASCDCEIGCPRCVYDRDCGNANDLLDRRGGLFVLRSLAS